MNHRDRQALIPKMTLQQREQAQTLGRRKNLAASELEEGLCLLLAETVDHIETRSSDKTAYGYLGDVFSMADHLQAYSVVQEAHTDACVAYALFWAEMQREHAE